MITLQVAEHPELTITVDDLDATLWRGEGTELDTEQITGGDQIGAVQAVLARHGIDIIWENWDDE